LRRRRRSDLARKGQPIVEADLPSELPGWNDAKVPITIRFPARMGAFLTALAEIEDTSLTALLEEAGYEMMRRVPRDPNVANAQQVDNHLATTVAERTRVQHARPRQS
jgi:hypothetical protein